MKGKLNDEIKRAGLEYLAREELELNSDRLRTFDDARLEFVTYVEAKFGLRIRDSKPSACGGQLSLSSGKGKGSSSPRDGCLKCCRAHFQRDCNLRKRKQGKFQRLIQRNQKCKPRCQRLRQR